MAFEQTQQTRVESKQWSGDWAGTMAPQGNGGPASEPYWSPSEAIDFSPLAKGINDTVDMFETENKQRAAAAKNTKGGEFLNRAMDIVSLNTDSNGVLSSKGEEAMRNLRLQMGREGYNDAEIQRVLTAVGQDYKSTMQGMMQEEQRKHTVEQEKALATKAVELYPELTGRTLAEQAEVGRNFYRNMNVLAASLEAASNPNQSPEVHDTAISEAASTFTSLIGTDKLQKVLTEEINAQDELEIANQITNALVNGGLITNVRQARALGTELSASFVGKARENREKMEKLTVEEKERFVKVYELNAKTGLMKSNPELASKLSLVNWDLTKIPDKYIDFITDRFDTTHFGGDGETHYWQGGFDNQTANFGVQNGTPNIADASQLAMVNEGLRIGDASSADQVYQSLMSDNMAGVLNAPAMAKQREASVAAYKERLAGLMINELRPHILSTTGYAPRAGKAIDAGFWDSASKINPILNKWKEAMRHIGMSDEEVVETGVNAMKSLGVKIPENTTNPEAFYNDSVANIRNYILEHPVRSTIGGPFNPTAAAMTRISQALNMYNNGKLDAEEAIARMSGAMSDIGEVGEIEGLVNLGIAGEQAGVEQAGEGVVNMTNVDEQVLSSPEFRQTIDALEKDTSLTPEQKSESANKAFEFFKELFGVKSARAEETLSDNKLETSSNFKVKKIGQGVKNNNIFNTRGKNKATGFASFKNRTASIEEAIVDAKTKLERFKGDVMKLCNQYAPREDNNLTSRYCCGVLYRTPGVSDADKETINEIVQQIKAAPKEEKQSVDKYFENIVSHFAKKYQHLFYNDGKVVSVKPIILWQALMETGTELEYQD